jgi:thiol-disulfide isomerase/thioredoxin
MMFLRISFLCLALGLSASGALGQLRPGLWRVALDLGGAELPFHWEVNAAGEAFVVNGSERLATEAPRWSGDTLRLRTGVFDSEFIGLRQADGSIAGRWHAWFRSPDYSIPFRAAWGEPRRFLPAEGLSEAPIAERWALSFSPGSPDAYPAVGVFRSEGGRVEGTILTETGDYRYLEGIRDGDSLRLSAFDGSHAFLFSARIEGDSLLRGIFRSGNHFREAWVGRPDPAAALRDPDEITYLKPGYERLAFSFPSPEGRLVSPADSAYRGKVLIVQVLGSWCPNCMDETRQLVKWHAQYQRQGLEVIGLAYERTGDSARAMAAIRRMKSSLGVPYEVLLASTTLDKAVASKTLPMLSQILAYPTAIYIDRSGKVRKIHTGYYGPGTGEAHLRFVETNSRFLESLLREPLPQR